MAEESVRRSGRSARGRHGGRWRLRGGDVGRAVLALAGTAVGLWISAALLPDLELGSTWHVLVIAAAVLVIGAVLRPLLVLGAVRLSWVGVVLLGLFGQALVIWLVLLHVVRVEDASFWASFWASWITAAVSTLLVWVATAGTDDAITSQLLRQAHRHPESIADADVPGIVFVQADGVPYPVLEWGVRAGVLPTLSRWIRDGSHHMTEWRPRLPATTPASQLGILHGTTEGVPAFRWVDRAEQRVFVANKASDAAVIEARHANGRGLLADDGVSVSNLFTGDAPIALATMSAVSRTQETHQIRSMVAQFLARPNGLARSLSRAVSEIVRERFQSARARRLDIRPRVRRGWDFTVERAALNGVIHDLNTTLVGESMLQGRRSIYVDYVDYDAVAHHVGVMQPEAMDALRGIDRALGQLERIAAAAPRPYHFVVLSDHGQSQGETFADRYDEDLAAVVRRLAEAHVTGPEDNAEGAGTLNSLLADSSDTETVLGRVLTRASTALAERTERGTPARRRRGAEPTGADHEEGFLVFGSGNLGLVYVAGEDHRLKLGELIDRYPALVAGLVAHPGVGFVVVDTIEHGPVALGARGEHRLRDEVVIGDDPLAPFGPEAPAFVLRAATMPETPDIYVNSLVDDLGEVAAFEGLVGCHGGLGGWQDRAMLVWPAELEAPDDMVVGADTLHHVLVGWLEHLGHRTEEDLPIAET